MSGPPVISDITLHALRGEPLEDPSVRDMIIATAHAIGERQGVSVIDVVADERSVTMKLEAERLVAIGFAAELRRVTTNWYREKYGAETLWGEVRP